MPNRVQSDEVAILFEGSESVDFEPFIADAHILVDEALLGAGYLDPKLKMIEKYLAAHLYILTSERGGLTLLKVGESEERYSPKTMSGLRGTRFGELAASLDTTNALAALLEPSRKALFRLV